MSRENDMIAKIVINLWKWINRQGFPCLFRSLTGLYCPGCGGTRAFWYLLHGQIGKSLYYHPLVPYMAAVLAAEGLLWLRARKKGRREELKRPYETEIYVGMVIALVNWAVKNWVLVVWGRHLIP